MTEPLAPEDFPGPPGLPFVGNVRAIDLAQPIESLMSLAREYGPTFKLTSPAGISVVYPASTWFRRSATTLASTRSSPQACRSWPRVQLMLACSRPTPMTRCGPVRTAS